jgi:hypothetical protein
MDDDIHDGLCELEDHLIDMSRNLRSFADDGELFELTKLADRVRILAASIDIYVESQKRRNGK